MPAHEIIYKKTHIEGWQPLQYEVAAGKKVEDVRHTNTNSGRFRALATLYFDQAPVRK